MWRPRRNNDYRCTAPMVPGAGRCYFDRVRGERYCAGHLEDPERFDRVALGAWQKTAPQRPRRRRPRRVVDEPQESTPAPPKKKKRKPRKLI